MENSNNLKVVAALVAGALAGTALALLFAPATGSDSRKKISNSVKGLKENIKSRMRHEEAAEREII